MGLCLKGLAFKNISIPLLEVEIFLCPLFLSLVAVVICQYSHSVFLRLPALQNNKSLFVFNLNDLGVGWGKPGQNYFIPATVIFLPMLSSSIPLLANKGFYW